MDELDVITDEENQGQQNLTRLKWNWRLDDQRAEQPETERDGRGFVQLLYKKT